jgi:hypothetical protein
VSERPTSRCGVATRALFGAIAIVAALALAGAAQASLQRAAPAARADSPAAASGRETSAGSKSPVSPPLGGGSVAATEAGGDEPEAGSSPGGETDPLVSNGLGSPLCRGVPGGESLSRQSRRNCETSGFVAAAAPTGNFGIDVHIDTGLLGLSSGTLLAAVQDVGVTPLWTALVWAVHALVVMLEWCFTIDLLDTASVGGGLMRGLRQMQAAFTVPWLATVFALGAMLAAYNGLIRRRVAETLGRVLLTFAMTAAGIWVMIDPIGTVGALGSWANQASLGTLGVTAHGTPAGAGRTLADSMATVFAAAIETPWCYLEFGNVGWCRNPSRIDPRLRTAGRAIAASELARIGCEGESGGGAGVCVAASGVEAKALEHSASMLRSAQTNGAIFLALPANGPQRNAINESGSLLRAICQSDDATNCHGPAAAEAEFRTNHGTWGRVAGLALIVAGLLGLLLLLGFLALRLLAAALLSLLYLMLAPMAVLAPALGDGGRAIFRKWAEQLLGAVVSKLLCSFLLGATLAILGMLANLEGLGWWTEWLLMSAFWWSAFARRHRAMQIVGGTIGIERPHETRPLSRRVGDAFDPSRKMLDRARAIKERRAKTAPEVARTPPGSGRGTRSQPAQATNLRSNGMPAEQARRVVEAARRDARAEIELAPRLQARAATMGMQLERIKRAQASALATGDARRAARLAGRKDRIEGEMQQERRGLDDARRLLAGAEGAERAVGSSGGRGSEQMREHARFLDAQAALPPATASRGEKVAKRDYAALAGLAGYGPKAYEHLAPREQRAARVAIDRELALRSERANLRSRTPEHGAGGGPHAREPTGRRDPRRTREVWRGSRARRPAAARPSESRIMREAREVADRRKRQLGSDRP